MYYCLRCFNFLNRAVIKCSLYVMYNIFFYITFNRKKYARLCSKSYMHEYYIVYYKYICNSIKCYKLTRYVSYISIIVHTKLLNRIDLYLISSLTAYDITNMSFDDDMISLYNNKNLLTLNNVNLFCLFIIRYVLNE